MASVTKAGAEQGHTPNDNGSCKVCGIQARGITGEGYFMFTSWCPAVERSEEKPSLVQHYEAREREMGRKPVPASDLRLGSLQNVLKSLPEDAGERKGVPITTGVLDYFPLAIAEVARLSKAGNDQHNPGQPMHWARGKSSDHADCLVRHLIQRGVIDKDGISHTAKVAWRALALLQEELEARAGFEP